MASMANCMRMRVLTSVLALEYACNALVPVMCSIGPAFTGDARMSCMSSCMSRRSFCLMTLADWLYLPMGHLLNAPSFLRRPRGVRALHLRQLSGMALSDMPYLSLHQGQVYPSSELSMTSPPSKFSL